MTAISLPSAAELTPRSSQFLSLNLCVTKMFVDWQEYEKAIAEAERALAVDPSDPNSYLAMAYALAYFGRHKEAVTYVKRAMRLDPQ